MERFTNQHSVGGKPLSIQEKDQDASLLISKETGTTSAQRRFSSHVLRYIRFSFIHSFNAGSRLVSLLRQRAPGLPPAGAVAHITIGMMGVWVIGGGM